MNDIDKIYKIIAMQGDNAGALLHLVEELAKVVRNTQKRVEKLEKKNEKSKTTST